MSQRDDHKILAAHVEVGKRLVPKIFAMDGFVQERKDVPYVQVILPELLWLAILNKKLGLADTAEIIDVIASVLNLAYSKEKPWFAAASCFEKLNGTVRETVSDGLERAGLGQKLTSALHPFTVMYPHFPGSFLVDGKTCPEDLNFLAFLKDLLNELYEAESEATVFMCAQAVFSGFRLDIIRANPKVSLSRLPEVEDYPATEISKRVASSCRSASLMMVGHHVLSAKLTDWSAYFWNRGLELEPLEWE